MIFVLQNNILVIAMLTLILINEKNTRVHLQEARAFKLLSTHLLLVLVLDLTTWFLNMKTFPGAYPLALAANYAYYIEQAIIGYSWGIYSYKLTHIELTPKGRFIHRIPTFMALLLILGNPLTQDVFYISAGNIYNRGWGVGGIIYTLCVFYYLLEAMALSITKLIHSSRRERRDGWNLLLASALPILGAVLQLLFIGVTTIWSFGALGLLVLHLNVQSHHVADAERELERSRTAVMLSQIRPHFLYNSLVSIKELCDTGQQEITSKALEHFAYYLRGNLDSLSRTRIIPFAQEVSHVKDYLYLEKIRFEDKLNITWDLAVTNFFLPPLSLQPIVENAVRHGIIGKIGGGTLIISSEETEEDIIINVLDDGIGFDMNAVREDNRTHVGIDNVRGRLQLECGGTLMIESRPGFGTKVKIILPGKRGRIYENHSG